MQQVTRFSLQTHQGAYADWPGNAPLIVDGNVLAVRLPGYRLLHQFAVPTGYLLITDYDCPFEELTEFILLDHDFHVIDQRSVGAAYSSYALEAITWVNATQFTARFYGTEDTWHFKIRDWGLGRIVGRLAMQHVAVHSPRNEDAIHNDPESLPATPASLPTEHARYFKIAVWIPGVLLPLLLLLDGLHRLYIDLTWTSALVLYGVTYGTIAYWCFAAWASYVIPKKSTLQVRRLVNWAPCLYLPFYCAAWVVVGLCHVANGQMSGWSMMLLSLGFAPYVLGLGYVFTVLFIVVDSFIKKD